MQNTFNKLLETKLGQLILKYCYKSKREDNCFLIVKDLNEYKAIDEDLVETLPENIIGVIDNGLFLPYILYK